MKHPRTAVTAKSGMLFLQKVVNSHGSIFRPVHQEDDVGIDGFIEPASKEEATGRLIAVQVKAGDSYLSAGADEFVVPIDEKHLTYWLNYMLPVVLMAYSPEQNIAAWVSVRDYVEHEAYHHRLPVRSIRIPIGRQLDLKAIDQMAELARARADERLLIKAADQCLSESPAERKSGFEILANHPDSRGLRITLMMARRLITDADVALAKNALFVLGYGVGRLRWSWNPNNREERLQEFFAREVCRDLTAVEINRLLELCDHEHFHGPDALGERLFDVLGCRCEEADRVLEGVARDKAFPMVRRIHAAYLLCACDDDVCVERRSVMEADPELADLAAELFRVPSDPLE